MLLIIGAVAAVSVLSYFATTTAEQRAESRARFARWNPLFIALIVGQLAFIFWPPG